MSAVNPLDVSLDTLLAAKPKRDNKKDVPHKSGGGRGSGGVVKANVRQNQQPRLQQVVRQNVVERTSASSRSQGVGGGGRNGGGGGASSAILGRLGGTPSVTISNLLPTILPSDISELCLTIGDVQSVNFCYDSAGRSTGKVEVTFAKMDDAKSCVSRFHDVPLDGKAMKVALTNSAGGGASVASGGGMFSKHGGGANSAVDDEGSQTVFRVTMGDDDGRWQRGTTNPLKIPSNPIT